MVVGYILITGIHAIITKLGIANTTWQTSLTFIWGTAFILLGVTVFPKADFNFSPQHVILIIGGVLAFAGTYLMYNIFRDAELSRVVVLLHFSILLPVMFGMIVLHEPVTAFKVVGILLGVVSFILLGVA